MDGLKYVRRLIINQMENTYQLSKKAWGINWNRISEGDYYRGNIQLVYAETLSKAKSQLLKANKKIPKIK
jgi:hypothetical protein